jgi:hypothetical protein
MPKRVIHTPCKVPTAAPTSSAIPTASCGDTSCCTDSTAITAAHMPLTTPADRSMSPSSKMSTMPTEMLPTAAICSVRLTRLNGPEEDAV